MNDHDAAQTVESGLTWDDVAEEERRELDEVFGPEDAMAGPPDLDRIWPEGRS